MMQLSKSEYSKLVAVLSYMRECRMPLPPPYKEYAKEWEAIARELVTAQYTEGFGPPFFWPSELIPVMCRRGRFERGRMVVIQSFTRP